MVSPKTSVYVWDTTANNNQDVAGIGILGTNNVSNFDDAFRATMSQVKSFANDQAGFNTVGGTANAITLTTSGPFSAYSDGLRLSFRAGSVNTGAATINANSVGAKAIRKFTGAGEIDVIAGDLQTGRIYEVVYFAALNTAAGAWLLMNPSFDWEMVPGGNISVSAATSIPVINLSAYRKLRITGKLIASSAASLQVRTSTNNGVSYDSGASDYAYQLSFTNNLTASSGGSSANSSMFLAPSSIDASGGACFSVIYEAFNKAEFGHFEGTCSANSSAALVMGLIAGQRNAATAKNAFQIFPSVGNLTGTVTVEGIIG